MSLSFASRLAAAAVSALSLRSCPNRADRVCSLDRSSASRANCSRIASFSTSHLQARTMGTCATVGYHTPTSYTLFPRVRILLFMYCLRPYSTYLFPQECSLYTVSANTDPTLETTNQPNVQTPSINRSTNQPTLDPGQKTGARHPHPFPKPFR